LEYDPPLSSDSDDDATLYALSDTDIGSISSTDIESDDEEDNRNENSEASKKNPVDRNIRELLSDDSIKGISCRICFEPVKKREPVSIHCGHI
jgi:hypothetical protein